MISGLKNLTIPPITRKLRFLPYSFVGIAVFALNTNIDTNPYLQIYILILESQLGIVFVHLLSNKMKKGRKA
jgi:hypothetical protein